MSERTAIVTTTINIPTLLADYLGHFRQRGQDGVLFVVVGDRKSPEGTRAWLNGLDWGGNRCLYLDVADQQEWNARIPALEKLLPWNSIQRRNIGYLCAVREGAEVIISIDDDNHVTDDDFLAGHGTVGRTMTVPCVRTDSGWANMCELLVTDGHHITHRGYPQRQRHVREEWTVEQTTGRVVVNAGLWLGEPDVDAVSRVVTPAQVTGLAGRFDVPIGLAKGTWCPFNSQNTAFVRDLLPAAYLVVMGHPYRGTPIGRYDDIWMSYFVKAIADHFGDLIVFGRPLVYQARNQHDILQDLWGEVPGMILTERLVDTLRSARLTGSNYHECYREIIDLLRREYTVPAVDAVDRLFWRQILDGMSTWLDVCEKVATDA